MGYGLREVRAWGWGVRGEDRGARHGCGGPESRKF